MFMFWVVSWFSQYLVSPQKWPLVAGESVVPISPITLDIPWPIVTEEDDDRGLNEALCL